MLNHNQHQLLLTYFLTFFLFSSNFAQIDSRISLIKICSIDDSGGLLNTPCGNEYVAGKLAADSPNEVEITLMAHVVDIPFEDDQYNATFPENRPALYLRYQYGPKEYRYTKALINWSLVDWQTTPDGTVRRIYRSEQKVRVSLPKNAVCDPESSTINFSTDNRLYTYSIENNEWEEYPIYEFSGPEDIFSCDVFKETMHVCNPKLKPMDLDTTVDICVPCKKNNKQISVLSNPFSETLHFNYKSKNASELKVYLLSLNGETINSKSLSTEVGMNRMQISTDNIVRGTYFLSIFDGEENFVQKVVCVK